MHNKLSNLSYIDSTIKLPRQCSIISSELYGNIHLSEGVRLYKVILSGNVSIGRFSSLWGPNISIIAKKNPIVIGNFCSIASNVTFQEFLHDYSRVSTHFISKNVLGIDKDLEEGKSKGPIRIGHDVWIGKDVTIMSGVTIGTGAVIGANAVVTKDIPPYAIAVGCPAKIIKYRFSEDVISRLLSSEWWNYSKENIASMYSKFDDVNEFLSQIEKMLV